MSSDRAQRIGIPDGIVEGLEAASFDATRPVVRWACSFLAQGDRRRLVVLAGPTRTGKSSAAATAVLNARTADRTIAIVGGPVTIIPGEPVAARWVHARQLFHNVFDAKLWEAVAKVPVLVVDDLGAEPEDQRVTPLIASVLCERVDGGKKTIGTTNLALDRFKRRYGERVFGRLAGEAWYGARGRPLRQA